ncbi:MAG: SRPBCC family protein [Solirubrobacterales bacterium]|nr:SRPBCC family protein [Solirubrobacterales bacterium]
MPGQGGGDAAAFHFLSRWELACPRERVWDTLVDFHTWPIWWPGLDGVIETIHGDAEGIGQRATSTWRGPIGYSLEISIESVERVHPEFLRGVASGDVTGEGTWRLSPGPDGWTGVDFDWNVRANRRWMEFLAPVARPLFVSSHDHVMKKGAEGLADHLGCQIRSFEARAH